MNKQTNRWTIRLLDTPGRLFARGSMFHIHILYLDCNSALMQAFMIYLITRYDIAVIIFILFMFLTAIILNVHDIYISK